MCWKGFIPVRIIGGLSIDSNLIELPCTLIISDGGYNYQGVLRITNQDKIATR